MTCSSTWANWPPSMPAVRSLLARVARLEHAKEPAVSPFERTYGSLEGFAASAEAGVDAGALDRRDGACMVGAVRRWHADRAWGVLQ